MSLYDDLNSPDDLQRLVDDKVPESDVIEYKTMPGKADQQERDKAAQDIAAFANASGGLLIFGVATTDKKDPTRPTGLAPIDNWNAQYIQVHAREIIRQPIPNIRVKTIRANDTHQFLLFDIPLSQVAPHQVTTTKQYYRRDGPKNEPMAHDLIELYFGRRLHPKLEPHLPDIPDVQDVYEVEGMITFVAKIGLLNVGGMVGRDVLTRMTVVDSRVYLVAYSDQLNDLRNQASAPSTHGEVRTLVHHAEVYYPGLPKVFGAVTVKMLRRNIGRENPIFYLDVYGADMRPRRYNIHLSGTARGLKYSLEWEESPDLPPISP